MLVTYSGLFLMLSDFHYFILEYELYIGGSFQQ